jgi:hypothetical protein
MFYNPQRKLHLLEDLLPYITSRSRIKSSCVAPTSKRRVSAMTSLPTVWGNQRERRVWRGLPWHKLGAKFCEKLGTWIKSWMRRTQHGNPQSVLLPPPPPSKMNERKLKAETYLAVTTKKVQSKSARRTIWNSRITDGESRNYAEVKKEAPGLYMLT